jgi:hypothetical protein
MSPTLRSRHRKDLRVITDVLILTKDATFGGGMPIFDDLDKDPFLSPQYSEQVKNILKSYGLKNVSPLAILELLEKDLRSLNSKMHGAETDEDWHSVVANLLSSWMDRNSSLADRLKNLPLIPLRDGKWISATLSPIYIPTTKNIAIPERLDIRVLQSKAISNIARKNLFARLEVLEANINTVRASILRSFASSNNGLLLSNYKAFLDYLYLTHQPGLFTPNDLVNKVQVVDDQRQLVQPHTTDIYLPGKTHSFGPESPGLSVKFIHTMYMENIPEKPDPMFPSWEKWLFDSVGIRERLRLVDPNGRSLSEALMYVHKHRPEKFIGLLKYLWRDEKSKIMNKKSLRQSISALPAKELCEVRYDITIGEAWLPLEGLRNLVSRYMEFPQHFPFLKIDSTEPIDRFSVEWSSFTDDLEVKKDENLVLYISIMHNIRRSHLKAETISAVQSQKIFDLYAVIFSIIRLSGNQETDQRAIK